MRNFVIFALIFATTQAICQPQYRSDDTITIAHLQYTTTFSRVLGYPIKVEWWNSSRRVTCGDNRLPRKDQFQPDPDLYDDSNLAKAYYNSGYDRGHMCPAGDNGCGMNILPKPLPADQVLRECFYFTNMVPQPHSLNAGDWEDVERKCRQWSIQYDSVHIWAGGVGDAGYIGNSRVWVEVPTHCWKVVNIVKTGEWHAYIFDNAPDVPSSGGDSHEVQLKDVEVLTGFKFKQ